MKPFIFPKTLLSLFFCICLIVFQGWTLHIVEIEESSLARGKIHIRDTDGTKVTSPTQLRLVDFDVTHQRFEHVYYLMTPDEDHYTYDYKGMTIGYQRDRSTNTLVVSIEKGIPHKETWFVGSKKFFKGLSKAAVEVGIVPEEGSEERLFVRPKGEQFLSSATGDLLKTFKSYKSTRTQTSAALQADFINTGNAFTYNITGEGALFTFVGKNPHDTEMGDLGERAADLTFFAYGFTKKASKMNGKRDNGFDGVYYKDSTDPAQKQLWIVEAKFHDKSKSENYFDKELAGKIAKDGALEKYRSSKDHSLVRTAEQIDGFVKESPQQIFFLGYDVLSDGRVKMPLLRSYEMWFPSSLLLLKKESKPTERASFLQAAVSNYVKTSPKKEDPLVLAQRLLAAAGIKGIKLEKAD